MVTDEHNSTDSSRDSNITCLECGNVFGLREGEQDFFVQRGLNLPKRCPQCRADRRVQSYLNDTRTAPQTSPNPHKQSTTSQVECRHCSRVTVVPFIPREDSEVYCRICWEGIKNVGTTGAVYV